MIDVREQLTDDAATVVMLCSRLGISDGEAGLSPLTLKEWNGLARRIHESGLKRPGALSGVSAQDLSRQLGIADTESERIARLLDRGGSIALELEQLAAGGIWCVTRVDDLYPSRIKNSLKHQAPPVLFGCGDASIFERLAVGIVGSRNVDDAGANFARRLGEICARSNVAVVSGGARGTDRIAMQGAMDAGGRAVGVLADSLTKTIRQTDVRNFIVDGRLVLLTPYRPDNAFSIGGAMGRNKMIYGASEYSVIVSSNFEKGGTWAGAIEALTASWCPLFVRAGQTVGRGNQELIGKGGHPLSDADLTSLDDVIEWMKERAISQPQQEMLSFA
ncbi:MAG TPA: DNA-processing protein DprA [Pyrinomonadaceae bacterium]|nr:DNA-processing protein DprA [Pyrinomonadaceae bacterium]